MPALSVGLRKGLGSLLAWLLLAGATTEVSTAAETTATVVWFQQRETGIDPYAVRYIVTPDYMRSDDGLDDGDFLLFDRHRRRIYSVVRGNRSVLEIDGAGAAPEKPHTLQFSVNQRVADKAPPIAGESPLEVELVAGGEVCHSALVVPGFLESVRLALQEFNQALAVQQRRTLAHTPVDMQTPCFLSRYLYATDFHLSRGMLLADWNSAGERRELSSYENNVIVDNGLFVVPADYRVIPAAD
jgi:hypothetical protein